MSDLEKKFVEAKGKIDYYLFRPYLYKYIIPPTIDEDKLLVLLSITDKLELSPYEKDIYIIAIMLMYIALDTHDNVANTIKDEDAMQINQLTVLAGDYYSGLYYKLLAKIGDIKIIKALSEGVKDINEHKVLIYNKNQNDLNVLMDSVKTIEFSLIGKLTNYFGVTNWDEQTANFLLYKRLLKEKKLQQQSSSSVVFNAMDRIIFPKERGNVTDNQKQLMFIADDYINNMKQALIKGMDNVGQLNGLLEERMNESIKHHYPKEKTFVEEG